VWVRRTRHLTLATGGDEAPPSVVVHSLLTGRGSAFVTEELDAVLAVPANRWTWRPDDDAARLARAGVLVSDEPGEPYEALRHRDEELSALGWLPAAAAFHMATRWESREARVPGRDGTPAPKRSRRRPPLPPLHVRGGERVELPEPRRDGELHRILHARRTVRSFDPERPVTAAELATVLSEVWGVHASVRIAGGDTALRKTSPSGGGLHPVEAYPIVRRVAGIEPGVYHYLAGAHALERLAPLDGAEADALFLRAVAGQWYFAEADVLVVLAARVGRSFWKYRRHAKAYRTLLLDAGHLSQTFYLVCTELGLGPFVTGAANDDELERTLGLDPLVEAPLAVCGCGRLPAERSPLDLEFLPGPPAGQAS
jgi:putative peptide maturation dehydrogenase